MRATAMVRVFLFGFGLAVLMGCQTDGRELSPESQNAQLQSAFSWLEPSHGVEALAWVERQNRRTAAQLQGESLYVELLREAQESEARVSASAPERVYFGAEAFALFRDASHPAGIWRRTSVSAYLAGQPRWRDTLDIGAFGTERGKAYVGWLGIVCEPVQRWRCLVGLNEAGSRSSAELREFDMSTGRPVADGFSTHAMSVAWSGPDSIVTTEGDALRAEGALGGSLIVVERTRTGVREIIRGLASDRSIDIAAIEGSNSDAPTISINIRGSDWRTREFRVYAHGELSAPLTSPPRAASLQFGERLLFLLQDDWSLNGETYPAGTILAARLADLASQAPAFEVIAEASGGQVFQTVVATQAALFVVGTDRVRGRIWRVTFDGARRRQEEVAIPEFSNVSLPQWAVAEEHIHFYAQSFLRPRTLYALDPVSLNVRTLSSDPAVFDATQLQTEQFEAQSQDGTLVPYFVVRRSGSHRSSPTLIFAYGAHGGVWLPTYAGTMGSLWLSRGGVYVLANVRGGGELGRDWHVQGRQRLRTYEDIEAVARDLVRRGITTSGQLGIKGLSSGGLLAGVAITRTPALFHAAIIEVPLLDQFRPDLTGYGSLDPVEWGDPANALDRAFLESTSPFQNVSMRMRNVEPFLLTSTTDDTARPAQARQFAARMEALGMPFYFYETSAGGHALAVEPGQKAQVAAMQFTYLWRRLGAANAQ